MSSYSGISFPTHFPVLHVLGHLLSGMKSARFLPRIHEFGYYGTPQNDVSTVNQDASCLPPMYDRRAVTICSQVLVTTDTIEGYVHQSNRPGQDSPPELLRCRLGILAVSMCHGPLLQGESLSMDHTRSHSKTLKEQKASYSI